MELNVMLEPQEGLTYEDLLAVARHTERVGLPGMYRSDHYSSTGGVQGSPSTDAWATLAGLARETSTLTLGTLVSPATFRRAGNLAKTVATVATMAGRRPDGASRIHLGMGTGWHEGEHREHGFPFHDLGTRFRRLGEHLQVIRGLWDPAIDRFSFDGEFERLEEARFAPKPDPRPRLIVGGMGMEKTPRLAARYADELNGVYFDAERCRRQHRALLDACAEVGRDPAEVGYSLMTGAAVGETAAEVDDRIHRLHERSTSGRSATEFRERLERLWVVGTPDEAVDRLRALGAAGVERVMLQLLLADDLAMLDVLAHGIAPRLR